MHKPLTETKIKAAKAADKPYKLRDDRGLYLLVMPTGARLWRLRFTLPGRVTVDKNGNPRAAESMLSLGSWPDVLLDDAREKRDELRRQIAKGENPSDARRAERGEAINTFEAIARKCLAKQQKILADSTFERFKWILEKLVFPYIGSRPIKALAKAEVRKVLERVDEAGNHVQARRTAQRINQVMRFAADTGCLATEDAPAWKFAGALTKTKTRHHAAIKDPARVGSLLRTIDGFRGHGVTSHALKLSALLFVRPGELRHMEWSEVDLDGATWRIPAHKMKMREIHIVPLAKQSISLLRELYPHTGKGRYVFPSLRSDKRPMSENAVNGALRGLGIAKEEHCAHGFRGTASTLLHEGFNGHRFEHLHIEAQLSHAERSESAAAYNAAAYLPQRREMMQAWADYLDTLRAAKP